MRPTLLKQTIIAMFNNGGTRALCVTGAPGAGKTTLIKETAEKDLEVPCIVKHMPTSLVEDMGVPDLMTEGDTFGYKTPGWFPGKGTEYDDGRGGILCLDDRNQCGPDLQKVLAHIIQERDLHGIPMADGWMPISTGNREEDKAGSNRVLSHLADRESTVEFETHLNDWTAWAVDNGVHPLVISFIQYRPGLLHDFDPQRPKNATPRGWSEGVSPIIGVVPKEAEYEMFKGAVGEGPAAEFVGFVKIYRDLPNPDAVLLNPEGADVPTDPATLYALAGALAERATPNNFAALVTYTSRMPPEFSVLAVSYAIRKDKDEKLSNSEAFSTWATTHQDVLF